MANPSGTSLTFLEKTRILGHAAQGRTSNLYNLLQYLAETKGRTVGQLILEARDQNGLGITHKAAENNKRAVIGLICSDLGFFPGMRRAVLNMQENGGRSAASIAAEYNHDFFLLDLVLGGANMRLHDWMHSMPLHRAAMSHSTRAMATLVEIVGPQHSGIDIQTISGQTPLVLALDRGDILRAGYLILSGANVELQTVAGITALHVSVRLWDEDNHDEKFNDMMHKHFMRIINAPGSGPNGRANLRIPDNRGSFPRGLARQLGHNNARNLLLAHGG